MVVGGPNGIVMPGATWIVGWMTVVDGGGGVVGDGGGGGACGTPAYPPISVGYGNESSSVSSSAPSIVAFQTSDGSPDP
jgi:hypothetical protein